MSTIAIDFDGVLSAYTGWKGIAAPLDSPVAGALDAIRAYQDAGLDVVIHTTRADNDQSVERLENWLHDYGLEPKRINKIKITDRKLPAVIYLDDRAMLFRGVFPSTEQINAFKTWQGF